MKIENEFAVNMPVEDVWNVLLDLERITPCLPGAALTDESGDSEYEGTMKIRLGPVSQEYNGTVKIDEADESNRRAVLKADGKDARGQGTASATITSTLHDEGNGSTRVHVDTDMQLTGRAAQFGRGVQQDVAKKLLNRFAECLENEIVGGGGTEEESEQGTATEAQPSANGSAGEGQSRGGAAQQQEGVEALDLGEASRDAILGRVKPLVPVIAVVGALAAAIWLLRRSGSGGTQGELRRSWSGGGRGELEVRLRF